MEDGEGHVVWPAFGGRRVKINSYFFCLTLSRFTYLSTATQSHSVWFQPTVEIMVWRGWKWIRMKERMVPRKKNKGKWLRFNKMLRDNLWFSWAAMEFVKWKTMWIMASGCYPNCFFFFPSKKDIHSSYCSFSKKKTTVVSLLCLFLTETSLKEVPFSLWGIMGLPTIRQKGELWEKDIEMRAQWNVRQLRIQRRSRQILRQNYKWRDRLQDLLFS